MSVIHAELVDHMGTDVTVVNAARVSMDKCTDVLRDKDIELIERLAREGHMSPFRHIYFQFRITAPEFVARQAFKHNVGISTTAGSSHNVADGWNEVSMRYVRMKEFYEPTEWRKAPKEIRQGSAREDDKMLISDQIECHQIYSEALQHSIDAYQELLKRGVAREMARMILPLSVQTQWIWTMSLQAVIHFVKLRQDPTAQQEIQILANQMVELVKPLVPVSFNALLKSPHV